MIEFCDYSSPCGDLVLGSYHGHLCLCDWTKDSSTLNGSTSARCRESVISMFKKYIGQEECLCHYSDSDIISMAKEQLDEYFNSERKIFTIPLLIVGTDFQKAVWNALLKIPFRHTISYSKIALMIAHPNAVRAVATAIGNNPISIIVPCHRVIGKNGQLAGYAGGLQAKEYLIKHEQQFI